MYIMQQNDQTPETSALFQTVTYVCMQINSSFLTKPLRHTASERMNKGKPNAYLEAVEVLYWKKYLNERETS